MSNKLREKHGSKKKNELEPLFLDKAKEGEKKITLTSEKVGQNNRTQSDETAKSKVATASPTQKKRLGVSLKAINEKKSETEISNSADSALNDASDPFSFQQLINAWNSYALSIRLDHHLKNSMLNCHPINLDNFSFEVIVENPMQELKLKDESINILNYLRKNLNNSKVSMNIRVSVNNERKVAFTPVEKFQIMVEKNDKLLLLKEKLKLEFS